MIININQYLYIKFINNMYCLCEKYSGLVIDTTLDLEQICEKIIQYYCFYLNQEQIKNIEDLIVSIRQLKVELKSCN